MGSCNFHGDKWTSRTLMILSCSSSHSSKPSFFVQKFNFDFTRKLSNLWGSWKTRENVVVLDFLAVDNFDFTRKIVKKIWLKNSWKCWSLVKIEFLDKNLTFRIVCRQFCCFSWNSFLFKHVRNMDFQSWSDQRKKGLSKDYIRKIGK